MTNGLYLGKFAPLHKGHEYCIETALRHVDTLHVLVYDEPSVTDIPPTVRSQWIRDVFPRQPIEVHEVWTAPEGIEYDDHTKALHERKAREVLQSDGVANIDVFFSSEPYGQHMASAFNATDFRIDEDRAEVPISATRVRSALDAGRPAKVRDYISDIVYRNLVTNVVILGGPSTGKSTLARNLANEYDTEWQEEVGREFWQEHADENGLLTQEELYQLACKHIEAERQSLSEAREYLFTDTNAITTGLFSEWYHGNIDSRLERLMEKNASRYDVFILCDDDIPFEPEPGRGGPEGRQRLQRMHEDWLNRHGVPFYRVSGTVEERINQVSEILSNFNKWNSERETIRQS
jgi:HTH-type transcriptional repressor of NAD biosynthesis genes